MDINNTSQNTTEEKRELSEVSATLNLWSIDRQYEQYTNINVHSESLLTYVQYSIKTQTCIHKTQSEWIWWWTTDV